MNLESAIQAARLLADLMPKSMILLKDVSFINRYCSTYFADLMGMPIETVLGSGVQPGLYDDSSEIQSLLRMEDENIIKEKSPKLIFKVNRFPRGLTPYLLHKSPMIDPGNQKVIGLFCFGFEVSDLSLFQLLHNQTPPNKKIKTTEVDKPLPVLTDREKQVIFLFLANLNSEDIGQILKKSDGNPVSKSTIDTIFTEQLYPKFSVHSRPALYQKLLLMGYSQYVPKAMLSTFSKVLGDIKIY